MRMGKTGTKRGIISAARRPSRAGRPIAISSAVQEFLPGETIEQDDRAISRAPGRAFCRVHAVGLLAGCAAVAASVGSEAWRIAARGAGAAVAPVIPATSRDEIVGRWGLAAYHKPEDRDRTEAARAARQAALVIGQAPDGGASCSADDPRRRCCASRAARAARITLPRVGRRREGPRDRLLRRRVLITRFIDKDASSRYGTMVYVRGAPACGARPDANWRMISRPARRFLLAGLWAPAPRPPRRRRSLHHPGAGLGRTVYPPAYPAALAAAPGCRWRRRCPASRSRSRCRARRSVRLRAVRPARRPPGDVGRRVARRARLLLRRSPAASPSISPLGAARHRHACNSMIRRSRR